MTQPNIYIQLIAQTTLIGQKRIAAALQLLEEGATIPFISRYRKEATQGLDEVQLADIKAQHEKLTELSKRKETIIKTIKEQEKWSDILQEKINNCWDNIALEDIYLPYKPKRKTRAEIARQSGLQPLADSIMTQKDINIVQLAKQFLNEEISNTDDALQKARDIIAETINEDEKVRNIVRTTFQHHATLTCKVIKSKIEDANKYKDYFEYQEKLSKIPSHRLMAVRRGEKEGLLRVDISVEEDRCIERINKYFIRTKNNSTEQIAIAIKDSYKRLLKPSIETEYANSSKTKADEEAIKVFAENLKQLLLAPPLGQKRVLGIDPGYRTGCKVVCLDAQGQLLHNENIYPHPPKNEKQQAIRKLQKMVEAYQIEAIAIGNGTASRETEQLVSNISYDRKVQCFVVSENGASIYSASNTAREEFPEYDVTVRGAVSIGRRLIDPLAELVKIDPKSIGVGQYQHDVDQLKLKTALDQTVENAVNKVGVNLNTASKHLLTYVSGLGKQLAQNIVDYRTQNGAFTNRKQLMKVPKLGAKTYEQCAGFLRINNGENPLDNAAVHPEAYPIVEKIAKDMNKNITELIGQKNLKQIIDLNQYITDKIGLPTLQDIIDELEKPGRDPRATIKVLAFDKNVKTINDINQGMQLSGIITNITNFGAFCDIGIKENGLIHISNLSDTFITNPSDIVSLHQHVEVKVLEVDTQRKRIQLKLIQP